MPREVLHLLGSAGPDGAGIARLVAGLVPGLRVRGFLTHAWFLDGDGPMAAELRRAGALVRTCGRAGALELVRLFGSRRFALVHQHAGGRLPRRLARAACGAPVIVHRHGRVLEATGLPLPDVGASEAAAVIATSRAVAEELTHPDVRVVHPGVPLSAGPVVDSHAESPAAVGAAGRLVQVKGYGNLLRAAALLRPGRPELRLEIAGDGPERPALERTARGLGLERHVTFLGWRADPGAAMKRWSLFVQPSQEEGFGIAALEAMAQGLPVVASRVGGLPELVDDGVSGLLVPAGDPEALARAVARVLDDPLRRSDMGRAARDRAGSHFSIERMANAIAGIYETVLSRAGDSRAERKELNRIG